MLTLVSHIRLGPLSQIASYMDISSAIAVGIVLNKHGVVCLKVLLPCLRRPRGPILPGSLLVTG